MPDNAQAYAEAGQAIRQALWRFDTAVDTLPVASRAHLRALRIRRLIEKLHLLVLEGEAEADGQA